MPGDKHDDWVHAAFGADPAAADEPGGPGEADSAEANGLDSDATLIAGVNGALQVVAEQRKRLVAAGLDPKFLDIQVKDLRAGIDTAKAEPGWRRRHVMLENLRHAALRASSDLDADLQAQQRTATAGFADAIGDLRRAAGAEVGHMPKGKAREGLEKRLTFLDGWIETIGSDKDQRKAKLRLEEIEQEAQSILNAAVKHTGNEAARQEAYSKALQDKFGFEITNPVGTRNTHFDRVYEMFEKIPMEHVAQAKLLALTYERTDDPQAKYGSAVITMGSFGAKPKDMTYFDPSGKQPVESPQNSFDISTLHELGHSVDDRWGVMAAHGSKPKCGGWRKEKIEDVAGVVADDFFNSIAGLAFRAPPTVATAAITEALQTGKAKKPAKLADSDWKVLGPTLAACAEMKVKANPWEKPKEFGDRVYHEAYPDDWVSCDSAKRKDTSITVRDYQWRSAAEFFAELYAYSWMNRKSPPGGIEDAIKPYMYQGP